MATTHFDDAGGEAEDTGTRSATDCNGATGNRNAPTQGDEHVAVTRFATDGSDKTRRGAADARRAMYRGDIHFHAVGAAACFSTSGNYMTSHSTGAGDPALARFSNDRNVAHDTPTLVPVGGHEATVFDRSLNDGGERITLESETLLPSTRQPFWLKLCLCMCRV